MNRPCPDAGNGQLCLGMVVLPHPQRLAEAQKALAELPGIALGTAQNHRVPAVAEIAPGEDEAMLERIEALPAVMRVDVVFAQFVPEDML